MIFKNLKPITPSQRNLLKLKKKIITQKSLLNHKIKNYKRCFGKNNSGKTTSYNHGGGHKKRYRKLNFLRQSNSVEIVTSIEYDPYRNSYIASTYNFLKNHYCYILAPKNLKVGDILRSGEFGVIKLGHSLPMSKIPIGVSIFNISMAKKKKSIVCRSAGMSSYIFKKAFDTCHVRLKNMKTLKVSSECFATIGSVSNEHFFLTTLGKAGRKRWLNKRPKVRGVAMNPVDHPHGGGEGKTSGGRPSVTPWGKPTKGKNKL